MRNNLLRAAAIICSASLVFTLAACGSSSTRETDESGNPIDFDGALEARDYSEYMTLGTYTGLEIEVAPVAEVTDEDVQEQIDSVLSSMTTTEEITDRATADGDTINLDFTGYLDGEAFDGGSATGYEYTVGSGNFIDDLDSQLAGINCGETYDLDCTFPDDYSSEDLAGKEVTFEVVVNYIEGDEIVPEWNDELVSEYTGGEFTTTSDYEDYIRENLEANNESNQQSDYIQGIWDNILDTTEFTSLPQDEIDDAYDFYYENASSYYQQIADANSMELEDVLTMFGSSTEDLENYAQEMAESEVKAFMIANMIAFTENIEFSETDYEAIMEEDAATYGFDSYEAFESDAGRSYLTDTYKYTKVLEWLQNNNTMVVNPDLEAETETSAE